MLDGVVAGDDLSPVVPVEEEPIRVCHFPASLNAQLYELQRYASNLESALDEEQELGDSALLEMEKIIENVDIMAMNCAVLLYLTAGSNVSEFVRVSESCLKLVTDGFDIEDSESKKELLKHVSSLTSFIWNTLATVRSSESMNRDAEVPSEMVEMLKRLKAEKKTLTGKLRSLKLKPCELEEIVPWDPARTTSEWFSHWIWEMFSRTRKGGDAMQRRDLFTLIGKVSYDLMEIKSLQEQVTSLRNLTNAGTTINSSNCRVCDLESSPFYEDLKEYAVFLSHIFFSEAGSVLPKTCEECLSKLEESITTLEEKRNEMETKFKEWQMSAVSGITSCDAELECLRDDMSDTFDAVMKDQQWPECEVPTIIETLMQKESPQHSSNTRFDLLIRTQKLWRAFVAKSAKIKQAIEACIELQRKIVTLSMDEAKNQGRAEKNAREMQRLRRHEETISAVLTTLNEWQSTQEEDALIESYNQVSQSFDVYTTEWQKVEDTIAQLRAQNTTEQEAELAQLDEQILGLRKTIIGLDGEITDAEIELAKLEEEYASTKSLDDGNEIYID